MVNPSYAMNKINKAMKKSKVKKDIYDDYASGYEQASARRNDDLKKMLKILEKMEGEAKKLVKLDEDWGDYEMDSLQEEISNKIYWMRQEIE